MDKTRPQYRIFQRGSKTYFHSSLFFPPEVRSEVFVLYGFVRVADDLVDAVPQKAEEFRDFALSYRKAWEGIPAGDPIVDDFVALARKRDFDPKWTEAFLRSMELDLTKTGYDSLEECLDYIYGSAEVIGLCMGRILGLGQAAQESACRMGRCMQYINFLRDVAEDTALGRRYLPLTGTTLKSLTREEAQSHPKEFAHFIRLQSKVYLGWQKEAALGYVHIPRRYLIPIKTASDLYNWTARQIMKKPMLVWEKKIKPSKLRIALTVVKNLFFFPRTSS